jgi:hypothetical protein
MYLHIVIISAPGKNNIQILDFSSAGRRVFSDIQFPSMAKAPGVIRHNQSSI